MHGADRWAMVERIYHEAVDRPVGERAAFLDSACAGDAALRHELESLLADDGPSLLERSALDVAAARWRATDTPIVDRPDDSQLRDPRAAGRRRHGRGLSRARQDARAGRRAQVAALRDVQRRRAIEASRA